MERRRENVDLTSLPYDLLLAISQNLGYKDAQALRMTCKTLANFVRTRSMYRHLAHTFLRRCRALPLKGFQQLSDLSTDDLICTVNKAARLQHAWFSSDLRLSRYTTVHSPPGEEVDWLSPITSRYSLCATKSGKVVCWDIESDSCLAQWDPQERWELWKCRVEFEIHTVFFTMGKLLNRTSMEFMIMQLQFPTSHPSLPGAFISAPTFSALATFRTFGAVMNIFLLDPSSRLLSAFIWIESSNTIGLYILSDWATREYVFLDSGIVCSATANWSCILHADEIVVHAEDTDEACQYFYPLELLSQYKKPMPLDPTIGPELSAFVPPRAKNTRPFIFPPPTQLRATHTDTVSARGMPIVSADLDLNNGVHLNEDGADAEENELERNMLQAGTADEIEDVALPSSENPFPWPWYPDSCHFVRQWWLPLAPSDLAAPKISCTVVLLARHDTVTGVNAHVLAQHYFSVPQDGKAAIKRSSASPPESRENSTADIGDDRTGTPLRMWYVGEPFEVVCVVDKPFAADAGENGPAGFDDLEVDRERPLLAVDFGHAVWVERYWTDVDGDDAGTTSHLGGGIYFMHNQHGTTLRQRRDYKRLRFVSFPPIEIDEADSLGELDVEGTPRTLAFPDELDLDAVETINIDQSQGTVIVSVRDGRIFVIYYE